MKLISIIGKSLKEQIRSFWVLLLTLSMGPFFIFVYYLIVATWNPEYRILVLNLDKGVMVQGEPFYQGKILTNALMALENDTGSVSLHCKEIDNKDEGIELLKNKKADALIIIPATFSAAIQSAINNDSTALSQIEFMGDLTSPTYLISAVWANEVLNNYIFQSANVRRIVQVKESALGSSATIGYFDMIVPGILILSLIMLMFTASIAFVSEVENKTIIRLKLSKLSTFEFLGGVGFIQLIVGIVSVILTLITAIFLGFHYAGSLAIMVLIAGLTTLSIITFSLIIAAITKSANEVLVVGNFPMFLFMFFTGAAFPMKSEALFTIAGYPITIQGLMSPTHAISALNKTLVMDMSISSIIPEMVAILILSVVYFLIGAVIFKRRHLKLS